MTQNNSYFHADRNDLLQFLQTGKHYINGLDIGCAAEILGTHLHFFTRPSLINILRETGWTVEKIQPNIKIRYLKWWYPYTLLEQFIAVQYFALASK